MTETYDEFAARREDKRKAAVNGRRPQLEMLRQAKVKSELLLADVKWDYFMSIVAATIEDCESMKQGFEAVVLDPHEADAKRMMEAKLLAAQCQGRIDMARAILQLPKDLVEMGEQAMVLLKDIDG